MRPEDHRPARWEQRPQSAWLIHRVLRSLMSMYMGCLWLAQRVGRARSRPDANGWRILLTGTFDSPNWAFAHLRPLAMARHCARLTVVSTTALPPVSGLEVVYPPAALVRVLGAVPARLLTFAWVAVRRRPHLIGGFHLLFNGLAAALLARPIGARSLYFCVGGPAELLGGGTGAENRLFGRLRRPDAVIEGRFLDAVDSFDIVITMGTRAAQFFLRRGLRGACHIIPGGLDTTEFRPGDGAASIDLIFVGRLAPVKRVDLFLRVVALVRRKLPSTRAVIVGDGPLRHDLYKLAQALEIDEAVAFVGHQRDSAAWLRQAKVFVLTSDSEGVALSMMEAMLCCLPVVVSRVGDLQDLVSDDVNGYSIADRTPEAFAARVVELLMNPERRRRLGAAARDTALRHELTVVAQAWDSVLSTLAAASCLANSGPTASRPDPVHLTARKAIRPHSTRS